ncbi:hypothetical protein JTB14_012107 [Gonioctena quinquepunctata]|nr:hypothetical protein JTB14_012107 [Gonioctena quinquepunctata]
MEELNLGGNETEVLNMDLEKIRIQQWINNIPSVHTFADKSISLSSRFGEAESFEVMKEVPEVEGISVKIPKVNSVRNKENKVLSVDAMNIIIVYSTTIDGHHRKRQLKQHREINYEALSHCIVNRGVLLRIIPVLLSGPEGEFSTFELFDGASTVTLLS